MKNLLLLFAIISAFPMLFYAQVEDQWIQDIWLSRTGMPNDVIYAFALDSTDNCWIGSDGGLTKYNTIERSWKVFNTANSGLSKNTVRGIVIDSENTKWIVTVGVNIIKYDAAGVWTVYTNSQIPNNENVNFLEQDAVGNLWIGTANSGLVRFEQSGQFTIYNTTSSPQFPVNNIRSLAIDRQSNLWIGTYGAGILKMNPAFEVEDTFSVTTNPTIKSNNIKALTIDYSNVAQSYLWIGTSDTGLVRYDFKDGWTRFDEITYIKNRKINDINCITVDDSTGSLWVGTAGLKAELFDGEEFVKLPTDYKFPSNYVGRISVDNRTKQGIVWFGTDKGLAKHYFNANKNVLLTDTYNVDNSNIATDENPLTIVPDKFRNCMWIGTNGGGLVKYHLYDSSWTYYNKTFSLIPSDIVKKVVLDNDNIIWIATSAGLVRFDGETFDNALNWRIYNSSNSSLISNTINDVKIDKSNNKWIATNGGLSKFDDMYFTNYTIANSSIPSATVYCLKFDNLENIWLGTLSGAAKFNGEDSWEIYTTTNSNIVGNKISSIELDGNNNLWIATPDKGLSKFDGTTWTKFNAANSLLPSNKLNFIYNHNDNLWIGTSDSGLVRFVEAPYWWSKYKTSNSQLANNNVLSFYVDSESNEKWIGTSGARIQIFKESIVSTEDIYTDITPDGFSLSQNFPNPFNPTTTIKYSIPKDNHVKLSVFNILGQQVAELVNTDQIRGTYNVKFDSKSLSSGVYFYILNAGEFTSVKRMLLLK